MVILLTTVRGKKDKNDALLQELVASRNWKQALNHCEKRLKKGETTERLLFNKASILLRTGDKMKEKEGVSEIRKLLDRKPPITDEEVLTAVEAECTIVAAVGDDVGKLADTMWERAVKEHPRDEKLLKLWFEEKFTRRNYKAAQKAAMTYSKEFKDRRRPFYWAILALHLASTSPAVPQNEQAVFATMAYRLCTDAVGLARNRKDDLGTGDASSQSTNAWKGPLDNSRAIQSPGDLQLLVEVYRHQGRYKEALSILADPDIGIGSKIGQSSWELIKEWIRLYELSESWQDLWQSCSYLLNIACPAQNNGTDSTPPIDVGMFGDDWVVWSAMIRAASQIRTQECSNRTKAVISSYLENGRNSRNSRLAMIEFCISDGASVEQDPNHLVSALLAYYYDYSASHNCFQDLRCAYRLPFSHRRKFLTQVAGHTESIEYKNDNTESARAAYIVSEINSLKLDYALIVSVRPNYDDKALFEHFISTCLRLYQLSLPLGKNLPASERRPGDDAAILAAMGCVHLSEMGKNRDLLRAAVILEVLLSNSSHNYDALLLIIRVYFHLGAVSKGIAHYMKLDIKHIQHLTNSWILFTRISTIHPQPLQSGNPGNNRPLSPAALLNSALAWIDKNDAVVDAGVNKFLEYDSLANLMNHLDYAKISGLGMIKHQFMIERQRITRLGHATPEPHLKFPMGAPDFTLQDVRDRGSFPNYEAVGESCFAEHIQSGPMPGRAWLISQLLIIKLTHAVSGVDFSPIVDMSNPESQGLTLEELSAAASDRHLAYVLSLAVEAKEEERDVFCKSVRALVQHTEPAAHPWWWTARVIANEPTSLAQEFSFEFVAPDWHYFHVLYMFMEQCSLTITTLRTVALLNRESNYFPDQKYLDDQISKLSEIARQVFDEFHRAASTLRKKLREPKALKALTASVLKPIEDEYDPVGKELHPLVDDDWMDSLGGAMIESWQEALDGVLRTEVRI